MKNHAKLAFGHLALLSLVSLLPIQDAAAEYITDPVVESIVRGDQSYAFPAGFIRLTQPFDGMVNQVTGDNQLTGNRMMSGGTHWFYLRMNAGQDVAIGDLYTVYRRAHKVYHPVNRQYLGELIHQLGVVKIMEIDGRVATGKLVASVNPVGPGDHLVRFTPPSTHTVADAPPLSQAVSDLRGMVIDFLANRTLVGQRNVVYIDRGRNDGLRPGDTLQIFRTGGGLPRRVLGEVRVVSTEEATSTVLVTKTVAPILIGDFVSMKMPAPAHAEASPVSLPITEKEQVRQLVKKIDDLAKGSQGQATMQLDEAGNRVVLSLDELVNHLYFESGDATVKAEGQPLLKKIGEILKDVPNKQIRVEGHADSQEIGPSLKSTFPSNWELSKARAAGVARYLVQEAGLDPDRLTSVGYGATQPVAPNETEAGRQKNRRVEIVFQAGGVSDVPAPAAPSTTPALSYTDQSLPRDSKGTTLSTVTAPSTGDSGPISTGGGGLDATPVPTPGADLPGLDLPRTDGPSPGGPTSQSDVPSADAPPADGKPNS